MLNMPFIHIKEVINIMLQTSDSTPGTVSGIWAGIEKDREFTAREGKNAGKTYKSTVVYLKALHQGVRSAMYPIRVTNDQVYQSLEALDKEWNGKTVKLNVEVRFSFGKFSLHLESVSKA